MRKAIFKALLILLAGGTLVAMQVVEYKSGIVWPEPPVIDPGLQGAVPSDAMVLFDGKSMDQWENGEKWIIEAGVATSAGGTITSKQKFGDCQMHVEFATPVEVKGNGQGRGNSGIYLMSRYEVQILDSYDNTTYFDGQCGAIYKEQPPIVNACRKPGEWQTYDIVFNAPRFNDDGTLQTPGYVTVLHNGILIHNHFELLGGTSYTEPPKYVAHAEREPIQIQFHGNPVRFRNIWLRENIQPLVGLSPDPRPNSRKAADFDRR
jgi:hypothetical protein